MEIRSTEEIKNDVEEFATKYLSLEKQIGEIKEDIKSLQQDYEESGVPTSIIKSMIRRIKADLKKKDSQKFEEQTIKEWLESNTEIKNAIERS